MDVNSYNNFVIPEEACQDLWRERVIETGDVLGYYVGHKYYENEYFQKRDYVSGNPLPYNQSLSIAQCFPVLYRISGDEIWKEKAEKSWNWFRRGIREEEDICWWYYSEYYNWCKSSAVPIENAVAPEDGIDYYEDYEGHYSIDLMFIIEAHKIGVVDDSMLSMINENKKSMALSGDGWPVVMTKEAYGQNNLKAAVYFDYFVSTLQEFEYIDKVFPVLGNELKRQYENGVFADNSTGINGTCLRLLSSAYAVKNETSCLYQ